MKRDTLKQAMGHKQKNREAGWQELLEACKYIVNYCEHDVSEYTLAKLRAAIAKASEETETCGRC